MSVKKVIAVILTLMLTLALASGCGPSTPAPTAAPTATPAAGGSTSTPAPAGQPGDYPTISMMTICGAVPADTSLVSEKLSEITREKIGANVEIIPIEIGNLATQLNLLLSGGDNTLDIYIAGGFGAPYGTVVNNGQALALGSLLEPYAAEMKAALGDNVFNAGFINGDIYGVATLLDQASTAVYNLRADIAAEFGYKNGDKINLAKLNELFKNIKEKYPDTPTIGPMNGGPNIAETRVDALGDRSMLGVLPNFGQDTTVINYYESDEFLELVSYFKQWKEMGCYMTDFLNVTDAPVDFIPAGKAFGNFAAHFSAEMNGIWASQNFGVDMVSLQIYEDAVAVTPGMFYSINPATKNAEEAAGFLYLMATDPDVVNLLVNGVEGVHYQVLADGTAAYMDGKDVTSTGWSMGFSWTALNSTISRPFNYPADYYDQLLDANKTAHQSKAFGCQFDTTSVSDAISACTNVVNQYRNAISSGSVEDFEVTVAQFQKALKDAGIDEIIAVKQAQLDAFLAG